jgi:hypothetical protein
VIDATGADPMDWWRRFWFAGSVIPSGSKLSSPPSVPSDPAEPPPALVQLPAGLHQGVEQAGGPEAEPARGEPVGAQGVGHDVGVGDGVVDGA